MRIQPLVVAPALVLLLVGRPARACSYADEVPVVHPSCGGQPEGAIVFSTEQPLTKSGNLTWTEVPSFSALAQRSEEAFMTGGKPATGSFRGWRASGRGVGRVFVGMGEQAAEACSVTISGATAESPPPFGEIDVAVAYTEGGSGGGGCCCPELDSMVVGARTPPPRGRPSHFAVWFGRDEASAFGVREPDAIFDGVWAYRTPDAASFEPPSALTVPVTLGVSADRERTGHGFGMTGRYCFALAWMDATGTIGERSPPTCLDTTNPDDPAVDVETNAPCLCGTVGRERALGSRIASALLLVGVVAVARRIARPTRAR